MMQRFDIIIAGRGLAGMTLALTLSRLRKGVFSIALIDRPHQAGASADDRSFAVSAGSRRFFDRLGLWDRVADEAQPIREMVITDSRLHDPVRPVFLTFGHEAELNEAFAHMVPEATLHAALKKALQHSQVTLIDGQIADMVADDTMAHVTLDDGRHIDARFVVACDGARSQLRDKAGIGWFNWSYKQSGIVALIGTERDHEGRAEEHFLPSGPFAILPLKGQRFSLVWTEADERVASLLQLDNDALIEEIQKRAGLKLGRFTLLSKPRAYPLGFGIARHFGSKRLALVGDAAHIIHPIAGQGFNLGLRDVAALADILSDHSALGLDPGSATVIDLYDQTRRADTLEMAWITDGLNRLFSNDAMPLRLIRDFGLGLVDRLPTLKSRMIKEASATSPTLPRLIRGESLPGL